MITLSGLMGRRVSVIAVALLMVACAGIPPAENPIGHLDYPGPDSHGKSLVVFFPGYRDAADVFAENNFVGLLNQYYPHVDAVAVDSHIGYFEREQLIPRLREDVIEPAVSAGYDRIVVAGASLGGLGAIWTAHDLQENVDGLVLFAPFLGRGKAIDQIAQHGSLQAWVDTFGDRPSRNEIPWLWLSGLLDEQHRRPILLAYGRGDRMAPLGELLASELPDDSTFTSNGGHKWVDWTPLWEAILVNAGSRLFPH